MTVPEENRRKTDAVDEAATGPGRTSPAEREAEGAGDEKERTREPGPSMRQALEDAGVEPEDYEE